MKSGNSGRIYGFLVHKGLSSNERDDLFQETFSNLHRSREKYSPHFPFAPWLFTICRNLLIDYYKAKRLPISNADPLTISSESTVEAEMNLSESMAQVPEAHQEILKMRYKDGLDFDEISRRLNTSPSNIRQIISRVLKKLRGDS